MKKIDTTEQLRKRVAKELAAERMMQQISQQQMADAIGTQKSSISRIESGKQNISIDYIARMAEILKKNVMFVMEDPAVSYGNESTYELKLYDEPLLRFRLSKVPELHAEILKANEKRQHLLPMDLDPTESGILSWLRRRIIPENRELVGDILHSLGLSLGDIKGIIDVCMGLSLNDSYWITQTGFEGSFADYNLYENRFSEALSLIAYTGYGEVKKDFRTSPELTTGGMLRKAWHFSSSKGIWLYKSGSSGFANSGNEPYSEYYASQVAMAMGLHAVVYELENWHHILASKCRLFTNIDTAFVPIRSIVTSGGIEACLEYYKALGDPFFQELASMLVFDAVVVNEDRHFGNFGLLRSNQTGQILSPAPLFDHGLSLLPFAMKQDFEKDINIYIAGRSNPYGSDNQYFNLCKKVIGPLQRKQLRRLIGFRFQENDICNLPTWRLRALEDMIQTRVRKLLTL